MPAGFSLISPPPTGRSAIAIVQIVGDIPRVLGMLALPAIRPGQIRVADLLGIDRGVLARLDERTLVLMPHAGPRIVQELLGALSERGLVAGAAPAYPEARGEIADRMLRALARAASPRAIELLLDQPHRWALPGAAQDPDLDQRSALLNRLIHPPTVVSLGRANIGKSTLLNALAGRSAAIVADEPGTTRDHVGVTLELDGLVVRWIDTPGLDDHPTDELQHQAQALALGVARGADLIVLCADACHTPPPTPPGVPVLTLGLRHDLGPACVPVDVRVCALSGDGLSELVQSVRERLVPSWALEHPGAWRFWTAQGEG